MARKILRGIPVSVGIAIGKGFFFNRRKGFVTPRLVIPKEKVQQEINRLKQAIATVEQELKELVGKIPAELKEHEAILNSHLMILKDKKLFGEAQKIIAHQQINAEWAIEKAVFKLKAIFQKIDNEYIRQRMQDINLVADKVSAVLLGSQLQVPHISERAILLAHDVAPSDFTSIEVDKIMAFATVLGGKTSHAGIMARSLQIPAVVGVEHLESYAIDGEVIILDGFEGKIILNPSEQELAEYTQLSYRFEDYQKTISKYRHLPAETIDGYQVRILANVEMFEEVSVVKERGGEGIGLYRTEYGFLNRNQLPDEEELVEEYLDLASIMYPLPVVIRTLDIGADKTSSIFSSIEETNPALGLRGIRFCLKYKSLFRTQLRAILRASVVGNLSIMFPMISGLHELLEVKKFLAQVQEELKKEGLEYNPELPLGIMIELPSAVLIADLLAQEVDFFSIGTNDLIQYSLGIDRTSKYVSYLYQPLHPAIVRSIKHVVDVAHRAGIEVSLCGELSADPFCVPILMGMEVDSLSLTPQAIPGIKRVVRQASMENCKELLQTVLNLKDVKESNRVVREKIFSQFPEELTFYSSLIGD